VDYNAIPLNRDLRASARQDLKGAWGKMALATFVWLLLLQGPMYLFMDTSDFGFFNPLHNPVLYTLSIIAVLVLAWPFALGVCGFFLKRIRREEISVRNIFDGFERFGSSFLLGFFYMLFVSLWSLLLIVPGIVKAVSYAMAYYIMYDDPEIRPLEAIKKSKAMMHGYKWQYFKLHLSFIGWVLLGVLPLGIGLLWVYPYMFLADAHFYENLKRNQKQPVAERASLGVVHDFSQR